MATVSCQFHRIENHLGLRARLSSHAREGYVALMELGRPTLKGGSTIPCVWVLDCMEKRES